MPRSRLADEMYFSRYTIFAVNTRVLVKLVCSTALAVVHFKSLLSAIISTAVH